MLLSDLHAGHCKAVIIIIIKGSRYSNRTVTAIYSNRAITHSLEGICFVINTSSVATNMQT